VSKLAFVYPGQGSQKVGMGADLRESAADLFDRWFARADEASGLPIREHTVEGPPEMLTRTDVAQPALFSISLAITELARQEGLRPDFVAGHSLGEYTAAAAAGALSAEEGIRLVAERGRLMAGIQSERPGAMAAVIGLDAAVLGNLCEQASEAGVVALANLNSPTQIVVSGEESGVERLMELAEAAEASRVVRLQVGAAFHSELMEPVQRQLAESMKSVTWNDPAQPLAANHSGQLVTTADDIRIALITQIASPVRWVDCVQTLIEAGVTTFLELGPGRVLSGLVRQINPEVETATADSPAKLREFAEAHPQFVG
jgi:[acyl-carrier-protein] S-malonyltransferase